MKKQYLLSLFLILFYVLLFSQIYAQTVVDKKKIKTSFTSVKKKSKADAGFFYVELTPTSALPYYFSNSLLITYKDSKDLEKQLDEYCQKLRDFAKSDGQDPANYNQKSSTKSTDLASCEKERKDNIKHLTTAGETVKETTLK